MNTSHQWLVLVPACMVIGSGAVAQAQVSAGGLGTRVNGTALGRCTGGICSVQGGTRAGQNQFYRFSQFDTRSRIQRVDLDTRGRRNVVVGVGAPDGSFFGAPVHLSESANLFWLSPGGIWLGQGARFAGASNLLLSTSPTMRFGGKDFNVLTATASEALRLDQGPDLDLGRLAEGGGTDGALGAGAGPIVLAGGRLRVDRNLLIDSGLGPMRSELGSGPTRLEAGESVTLVGGSLAASQLDVQAGTTAFPGSVILSAGWGTGTGALRLEKTSLRGSSVLVAAAGGLHLDQVWARAATPTAGEGRLQLIAGNTLKVGFGAQTGQVSIANSNLEASDIRMRAHGSVDLRNVRAVAGPAGDRGLIQIQTVNGSGQAVLEGADLEARRIVIRAETIEVKGNSRLGAPKGKIHLEARSGDLLMDSSTLDVGVHNIDDLRAEAPWTILSVDPDTGAEVIGRVEDPPSIGLYAERNVRITGGSLITASQDLSPILEEHPSLRRSDIRLTDSAGIVVVDAGQKLAIDSSSLSADASHNFAGNVVLRAKGQGAGSSLSVRHSVLSAEGGAGSGDIRLNSSNGIDIVGSILRVSSHNRMEDPTTEQPLEGYAFTRGEITLTNSSPDHPIDIRSSQLLSRQTFSGDILSPLKFNGDVGGTFSDEWEWENNDDLSGGGSLANTGGFITFISNGGIWIKDGSRLDVSSQPPGGGSIGSVRGFIRLASGKGQQLLIEDDVRLNVQASPVSGEIRQFIFDKGPFPVNFWGPVTNQNLFLLEGRAQDRVLTLFEPLRNSVDNGKTVVVIGPDPSSPITIELPDLGLPSSREPFNDLPVVPRQHRMPSGSASALTLALLPEGSAREVAALAAEVVEPLSEAKATQLFADEQQSASREVMTAMGLPMRQLRNLGIAPLQQLLRQSMDQPWRRGGQVASVDGYKPAILHLSLTPLPESSLVQLNQILIPADGPVRGWQTRASGLTLKSAIETFQRRLSQFGDLEEASAPGAQLASALLDPVMPEIQRLGINAVLLSLDRGLQGIPFAALPWGQGTLGEELALTVTPALALTDLAVPPPVAGRRTVLAGTGSFPNGLAPLPMARQELEQLARIHPAAKVMMDRQFQTRSLMEAASGGALDILHLATHAEFAPDRAGEAQVYTSDGALSLKQIGQHLHGGGGGEIGLFVLNACRTAIGNEDQELGIAGLALQTGASSALGNLWYVDDAMSAAFSVQYHRALQRGLRKDQALQFTQGMFRRGEVKVRGEDLVAADGEVLITGLSRADQLRLMKNSTHPYFWAGTVLSGRPW